MEYMHQVWYDLNNGQWAEINPASCPCRGRGWFLSDYDTYHRCPIHGNGVPHPQDECETPAFQEPQLIKSQRIAYLIYRDIAKRYGFTGNFNGAVKLLLQGVEPQDWVDAAQIFAEEVKEGVR
jgi:hypothetical protein